MVFNNEGMYGGAQARNSYVASSDVWHDWHHGREDTCNVCVPIGYSKARDTLIAVPNLTSDKRLRTPHLRGFDRLFEGSRVGCLVDISASRNGAIAALWEKKKVRGNRVVT